MKGENRPLVTDDPVEFHKHPISRILPNGREEFRGYTLNYISLKTEICEHVTRWTWKL